MLPEHREAMGRVKFRVLGSEFGVQAGFAQKVAKTYRQERSCGLPPHSAECLWLSA